MRVYGNTVSYPWTVMIHPHYTFTADWAVMSAWRLHAPAFLAITESYVTLNVYYKPFVYLLLHRNNMLVINSAEFLNRRCSWWSFEVVTINLWFRSILQLNTLIMGCFRELIIPLLFFWLTHFKIRFSRATRISIGIISRRSLTH